MYVYKHIVCVKFADVFPGLLLYILYFYVLVSLYYTLHLPKACMNQQVDMNPLMKLISRAAVSACAYNIEAINWTVVKLYDT